MAYTLEPLNISHVKSIEALWLVDAEKQTPQASLGEDILNPFTEHFENTVTYGAFTNGHLVAAMKWGQRRRDAPIAELGNLHPGDGVIFWLFFTDEAGAEALLAQSRSTQTNRLYAFPECGDMARYTIFETGMLSLHRRRLVSFLEDYGFTIPAGADWGPQERIGFHRSLLDRVDIPPLPLGFHIEVKQNDASCHLSLHTDLGERIGESTMEPARTKGAQVPHSFFIHWLGVENTYRNRGFGQILLFTQIEHARQQGITDLYLTTHSGRPAWKLYQRIGFKEIDRLRSYALEMT